MPNGTASGNHEEDPCGGDNNNSDVSRIAKELEEKYVSKIEWAKEHKVRAQREREFVVEWMWFMNESNALCTKTCPDILFFYVYLFRVQAVLMVKHSHLNLVN